MRNLPVEQNDPETIYSQLLFQLLKKPKEWENAAKKSSHCLKRIFEKGQETLPTEQQKLQRFAQVVFPSLKRDLDWFIHQGSLPLTAEVLLEVFKITGKSLELFALIFEKLHQAKSVKSCQEILSFGVSTLAGAQSAATVLQTFFPFLEKLVQVRLKLKADLRNESYTYAILDRGIKQLEQINLGKLKSLETRDHFDVIKKEVIDKWILSLREERSKAKNPYDLRTEESYLGFVGRNAEIDRIRKILETSLRHCHITGPSKIGKSALLDYLVHRQDDPYRFIAIIAVDESQFYRRVVDECVKHLEEKQTLLNKAFRRSKPDDNREIDQKTFESFLRDLFSKHESLRLVLCIDQFDLLAQNVPAKFFQFLFSLASDLKRLHFITASQLEPEQYRRGSEDAGSEFWKLVEKEQVKLGNMTDDEVEKFFELSGNALDGADRDTIKKLGCNHPFFVRLACNAFFQKKQGKLLEGNGASLTDSERQSVAADIAREIKKHDVQSKNTNVAIRKALTTDEFHGLTVNLDEREIASGRNRKVWSAASNNKGFNQLVHLLLIALDEDNPNSRLARKELEDLQWENTSERSDLVSKARTQIGDVFEKELGLSRHEFKRIYLEAEKGFYGFDPDPNLIRVEFKSKVSLSQFLGQHLSQWGNERIKKIKAILDSLEKEGISYSPDEYKSAIETLEELLKDLEEDAQNSDIIIPMRILTLLNLNLATLVMKNRLAVDRKEIAAKKLRKVYGYLLNAEEKTLLKDLKRKLE